MRRSSCWSIWSAHELGVEEELEAALVAAEVLASAGTVSIRLDLGSVGELLESAKTELQSAGCTVAIRRSPNDGRNKHSIGMSVTGVAGDADLCVWDSGEGELIIGASSEDVTQTHLPDLSLSTVQEALAELIEAVV